MINIKPIIKKALDGICSNVVDGYPNDWEKFPIVAMKEEKNSPHTITDDEEQISTIRYKLDVWTMNESASSLVMEIDKKISMLGLRRIFCEDAPEMRRGLKHKVLRYEGHVDVNNMRVYHD